MLPKTLLRLAAGRRALGTLAVVAALLLLAAAPPPVPCGRVEELCACGRPVDEACCCDLMARSGAACSRADAPGAPAQLDGTQGAPSAPLQLVAGPQPDSLPVPAASAALELPSPTGTPLWASSPETPPPRFAAS